MDEYTRLLLDARSRITEVTAEELDPAAVTLVDIRQDHELALGTLPHAITIPMDELDNRIAEYVTSRDEKLVIYCAVGERSAIAAAQLEDAGYANVASLAGGIKRWMELGRPTTSQGGLTEPSRRRYARHVVLPQVGIGGQQRILNARVLIVGAGGTGSPAALYLAAAGVGTIGLVDDDRVDISNLQRQILHRTDDAGSPKTRSASQRIQELNPDVKVSPHQTRLTAANALEIMEGYDIVVDGTDNFASRYLINDASMHLGIPVVHGSVFRFEGQVAVFKPHETACYRCVFPEPPPANLVPNCATAGVFGVLPGVVGTMQATEVLKLILGIGEPLLGRLLTYDALDQSTHTVRLRRREDCPACGGPRPALRDEAQNC
jgi:molybdopterin/thiamine biosynthesis adenylyltransferase/rhodanese-related sulfurtransferase